MRSHSLSMRPGVSVVDAVMYVVAAFMLCAGSLMLWSAHARSQPQREPQRVALASDASLGTLPVVDSALHVTTLSLGGRARIIYQFATTCHFCESQRRHIADVLSQLDPSIVLTVSEEPPDVTRRYWSDVGAHLPPPLSIVGGTTERLGITGVPALFFVGPDGVVRTAYVGTAFAWDAARFRQELAAVSTRTTTAGF